MANLLGYAASSAVLASFLMRTMVPLRLVAILSNVLFIGFAYIEDIRPVFCLHLALLPINAWRLAAACNGHIAPAAIPAPAAGSPSSLRVDRLWFVLGILAGVAGSLAVIILATEAHA
jgi:hypothetical protein